MSPLRATVVEGRLVTDAPIDLPEGTVVEIVPVDDDDDLDDEERAALHAELDRSWNSAKAGRLIPIEETLAKLRSRR